jgi:response regulator RpfG family c-di-GMP phosphodiesterase
MEFTRIDTVRTTILLVDRDPLMLTAMAAVMDMQGHRALLARSQEVALKSLSDNPVDLIVLAIEELESGCDFAAKLRSLEQSRDVPIIFLVPQLNAEWSAKLQAQGGVYSLLQPIDPHALIDLVAAAIWMPHVAQSKMGVPSSHLTVSHDWVKL